LLGLFSTQLFFTNPEVRYGYGAVYLLLALLLFFQDRRTIPVVFREAMHHDTAKRPVPAKPRGPSRAGGRTKKPG